MLMAEAVSQLAAKTPGKESVAMEGFARALRKVRCVALNTEIMRVASKKRFTLISKKKWLSEKNFGRI